MPNIFLTGKCNLKCSYCFADEFVNKANEEISLENFNTALNFIKTGLNPRIGLIGGEPLLHSEIDKILDILNNDNLIYKYLIYTNGIEIDKHIDKLSNKKTHIIINCNSPIDIGDEKYNKIKDNITELVKYKTPEDIVLGINLYSKNLDYTYIYNLMDIVANKKLRISTALPNTDKEQTQSVLEYFKDIKDYLFKFYKESYERGIILEHDCNGFPDCLLENEDKELLIKAYIMSIKKSNEYVLPLKCMPVIDIFPDLTAVRCFGLAKYKKISIKNFKSLESLKKYFYNTIDAFANLCFESEKCLECNSRIHEKCNICFTYKMKKSEKLKEFICNNI